MKRQTCPNCERSGVRDVFPIRSLGRVVECLRCSLQFADVYPDYQRADSDIYSYEYFEGAIANNARREKVFEELLIELESFSRRPGRLLDVGAGDGTLLKTASRRGWNVEGTEISSAMTQRLRSDLELTIHYGALEDIALPRYAYDAVVLNHVLEHVKNPRATLETVAALLRDGGVTRVEVPNLASLSCRVKSALSRMEVANKPWKHYSTGHHFWFFTPRTLRFTLESAGLRVISLKAPRKQWGAMHRTHRLANALYGLTFWGGHIVAYARRKP